MTINWGLRRFYKFLYKGYASKQPFHLQTKHYHLSKFSIQLLCMCLFYVSIENWKLMGNSVDMENLSPPLLFSFLKAFSPSSFNKLILVAPILTLATFVCPRYRSLRAASALIMLVVFAYKTSFGKNLHGELPFLYTALAFALIPTWKPGEKTVPRSMKHYHLHLYWFGLLLFLLPYTLSGLWKLFWGMGYQLFWDEKSFWSFDSMSYMLSYYSVRINEVGPWTDYIIRHKVLGYFLLVGGTYWEIIAILPLFRPRHWRLTAMFLVIFHLLSFYTLHIMFGFQFITSVFFLYLVPLHQESGGIRELIEDFPLIGPVFQRFFKAD